MILRVDYQEPDVMLDLWGGTSGTFRGLDIFDRVPFLTPPTAGFGDAGSELPRGIATYAATISAPHRIGPRSVEPVPEAAKRGTP